MALLLANLPGKTQKNEEANKSAGEQQQTRKYKGGSARIAQHLLDIPRNFFLVMGKIEIIVDKLHLQAFSCLPGRPDALNFEPRLELQ